jgi:hypothetical protein
MNTLISALELAAMKFVEPVVSTPIVGKIANDAASGANHSSDSLAFNLMALAVVLVACIWYLTTRRPYTNRRNRHVGPFTKMRNALGRIASFLP